ncbi:DmsC/YnfH family molybdoenzyme membrane anchor subunit [Thiomonas sp. FB-6]|uniref:dimethyl sulfoxide reductase anchor subunit family protein n=1 Tax=Thiomonas sp. FB-6 TaxID=1158291 RepID=UPI0003643142|nr:DmsC/YnfH family molybdoenzyme membrane anchor subunit [Thiomonas sp. FB-6]
MRPAWSVIWFTTLLGCAQGLVVALVLAGVVPGGASVHALRDGLLLAFALGTVALGCSFAHLGQPRRAWRAAAMWRTSWLSREVLAVPAFLALTLASALLLDRNGAWPGWLRALTLLAALLLWLCTGKVYAAIAFIREWATPLTPLNFALMGLASGHLLGAAWLAWQQAPAAAWLQRLALLWSLLAWMSRAGALARLRRLRRAGSTQGAIGAGSRPVRQVSRGFTAGSSNLEEFGLHAGALLLRRLRSLYMLAGFALPTLVLGAIAWSRPQWPWLLPLLIVQFAALLGERWDFFAQVDHPQNHYYTAAQ